MINDLDIDAVELISCMMRSARCLMTSVDAAPEARDANQAGRWWPAPPEISRPVLGAGAGYHAGEMGLNLRRAPGFVREQCSADKPSSRCPCESEDKRRQMKGALADHGSWKIFPFP